MKTWTESVTKFNGRIYYGVDKNGNSHDKSHLFLTSTGGHVQSGQVVVNTDDNLKILNARLFKNKAIAYCHYSDVVESEGIMA